MTLGTSWTKTQKSLVLLNSEVCRQGVRPVPQAHQVSGGGIRYLSGPVVRLEIVTLQRGWCLVGTLPMHSPVPDTADRVSFHWLPQGQSEWSEVTL